MASVIDDLDKTNLSLEGLRDWLFYEEDIPVTLRQLKNAVAADELEFTKISNKNWFSKRDGLNWLAAQKGKRRAAPKSAASQ